MKPIASFFLSHPAVFYAFYATLGVTAGLNGFLWPAIVGIFFALPYLFEKQFLRLFFGFSLMLSAFSLVIHTISFTPISEKGVDGYAWITIEQIAYSNASHKPCWIYKGRIKQFWGNASFKGIPYIAFLPKEKRYLATQDYLVKCQVFPGYNKRMNLKPFHEAPWEPLGNVSFAELRFFLKEKVKRWIEEKYSPLSARFLTGLITGDFDDTQLKQDFQRFGLLHLLAISGFHFGIIAAFLRLILRPFFSFRILSCALIVLLSSYFFFLGWGPSVVRAWITIILFYGASLSQRFSQPLNSLGAALLFAVLVDPLLIENLGFQFSVLTTAAILFFYSPCKDLMEFFSKSRSLETVMNWPFAHRMIYLKLGFLKENFALCFATTFIAIPLSLFYFQYFPLLSLIYNVFFPFLVSISITILLLAFLFTPFPFADSIFHRFNDLFTSFILNMTHDIPPSWDLIIKTSEIPPFLIIFLLILFFIITIYFQKYDKQLQYFS